MVSVNDDDLTPVERELVDHCAAGTICYLFDRPDDQRRVSASVLYELCVRTRWPVHAKGVQLAGASIDEPLDFQYATLRIPLVLHGCNIAARLTLSDAIAPGIDLIGCAIVDELNAELLRAHHLALHGSTVKVLRLTGARIDRHLGLIDTHFTGTLADGNSLNADAVHVGDAFLRGDFRTAGSVRLVNATVDRDLDLSGASLLGIDADGYSLAAQRVRVGGDVALRAKFMAPGDVGLTGAAINGRLVIQDVLGIGGLRLEGARCAVLQDEKDAWPPSGRLALRSFQFGALAGGDTTLERRLDWVRRQWADDWSTDPYEQLAAYYSNTGDEAAARKMRIAKNDDELDHLKRTRKKGSLAYRFWRRPFGWLVGYGYRRWPAGLLLVAILMTAGGLFYWAERDGAMVPNERTVDDAGNPLPCGEAYPCFNSWLYGADVVLPIIDFGQDNAWRPVETSRGDQWWIWARWAFIAIGWTLASVFVAAFTALVQRG
jgi:hypothetical protein